MLYSALAFLAGICAFQQFVELPPPYAWGLILPLPLVLAPWRLLRAAGFVLAGVLWAWWHASQVLALQLPDHLEGQDMQVEGVVSGIPETRNGGALRFRFTILRHHDGEDWQPLRLPVLVSWYQRPGPVQMGETWVLRVRLKHPHGFSNPGGFDYERWLFAERIRATGYVRAGGVNRLLDDAGFSPVAWLRSRLAAYIDHQTPDPARAALLKALSVGMRHDITNDQWDVLRRTGTSHLIAISGLHVGLVAGMVFFLTRRGWAFSGRAERWPAPSVAAVAAMLGALGYALLAGFEVPAQRATIMVWVWMLARLAGARPGAWHVWSLALWLVLLIDPLTVLSAGFWLSFGAVAWILYLGAGRRGTVARWRKVTGVQTALVIGLTPILWLCFQRVSLVAPLANLIAIPWVGLLVVPLLLLAALLIPVVPPLADLCLSVAGLLLHLLWRGLEVLAAVPASELSLPGLPLPLLGLFTLGLLCCLSFRAMPVRLLGLALLLPALWFKPARPPPGDVWFTLLDVGQGLASVVETHAHVLVFDTGPAFPSGFNTGDAVIAPFLSQRGHRRLDRLVISHGDNDHRGGAAAVFAALPVSSVHSGEPGKLPWVRAAKCAGQHWDWDGVHFEYLPVAPGRQGNNASCVLRIEAADGRVLMLPGDIEHQVESELVAGEPQRLASIVLVAPHHGSRTSSTSAFVAAVNPQYTLFATGYRNRFGFPKADVTARYRDAGAILFDTAVDGAVRMRLESGRPIRVDSYRVQAARYWH